MANTHDLEIKAKEMAEHYVGHKMTNMQIQICMERVAQEHPALHKLLIEEVRQIRKAK